MGTATVIRGDARNLPLADNSVDLVVTSPPYFALRSYQDGGRHYDGQLGSEPTHAEFVAALLDVTRECVRVLKPSGSLFVNLGDSYFSGKGAPGQTTVDAKSVVQRKSLIGIPWRYALACIDDLGLILRAEVVWSKPNGLPESVTDRVRRSHEQWFHFVVEPRYYSAVDEIREPYSPGSAERIAQGFAASKRVQAGAFNNGMHRSIGEADGSCTYAPNPLGKLPGSVWTIPTEPLIVPDHLGVNHFAAFPTEWPRRIITGWSPAGVCTACGEGRRPTAHVGQIVTGRTNSGRAKRQTADDPGLGRGFNGVGYPHTISQTTIVGYSCACPDSTAPTTPGVILDPFGGTGTTAMVAKALGQHGISVDLSADYCRLAEWRTNDLDQLAKVRGVKRSDVARAAEKAGMDSLFDLGEPA